MNCKWVHELTVERAQGAKQLISGYAIAWARQGFYLEREESSTEIRIRAERTFKWGED